jgi:hypothetical protein
VRKGITEPARYTELDLAYVEACETWRPLRLLAYDLRILLDTAKVLARGEGLDY